MASVQLAVMQLYPCEVGERPEIAWASCITAIDEKKKLAIVYRKRLCTCIQYGLYEAMY